MAKGKKEILEIEQKEGRFFIEIIDELEGQGFRRCDIAVKYGIHQSTINYYLRRVEELGDPALYGRNFPSGYKKLNIKQIEQKYQQSFKDVLKSLRYDRELTCAQIAEELGSTEGNIQYHMNRLGIQMNKSEARHQSISTGRTNYIEINNKVKRGFVRSYIKGSSREEFVRFQLKDILERELDVRFEFVIGFTDWSILRDGNIARQVDVPIVVIDTASNLIYKFALEYDGHKYHEHEVDAQKSSMLEQKGWAYLNIYDEGISDSELRERIEKITEQILSKVRR